MKDWRARERDVEIAVEDLRALARAPGIKVMEEYANATKYSTRLSGVVLLVIVEAEVHDQELWAHLSVSASWPKRIPSWLELRWCKDAFIGDRKAISVMPVKAEYVNFHPHVLHLWAPLERDPLPDFRSVDATGLVGV